jgi:hypothetical protein
MTCYAVYRYTAGSSTTIDGEAADALLEFDSEAECDGFMRLLEEGDHYRRVTTAAARKLAREIYGHPLTKLCTRSSYGVPGIPHVMMVDPAP